VTANNPSSDGPPAWLKALVLGLVIGPHWLLTRDLFDGAAVAFADISGHADGLYFWTRLANWPVAEAYHKLSLALAGLSGIHYLAFSKLAITGLLLGLHREFHRLAVELLQAAEPEAGWLALLCIISPALYTLASSQIVPLLLCVWLVFLGHRCFRSSRIGMRWVGLALMTVSFQLASNLVFAMALEVLHLVRQRNAWLHRLRWSLLLVAAAVAVYAGMRLVSPPRQVFAEYNQLLRPWRGDELFRIVRALAMFMTWGVLPLAACVIAWASVGFRTVAPRSAWSAATRDHGFQLAASAFLCMASLFPYVMVGKGPPLFTLVGIGSGLTEQVLRAAYSGPLAPTWANSSGRHAFLYAPSVALLGWFLFRWIRAVFAAQRTTPAWLLSGLLVVPMAFVLPAYFNKLETQVAELSLVKGLKSVPPAPGGIVEVHYAPISSWLVWTQSAGVILREAWGRSDYWPIFYSIGAYRDDMQWQYHVYVRDTGGLNSATLQHFFAMEDFPGERCVSRYRAVLPAHGVAAVLLSGIWPRSVQAATIVPVASECVSGRVLPNPTPDKKLIP
jgi:hypothetical protein